MRVLQERRGPERPLTSAQHFAAGASAGLVQVVFAAPSEHVKIQLQTGAMGAEHSSLAAGRAMLRRHGAAALFKGWQVCLLRDVPAFGAYFCGYEAAKRALTAGQSENETDLKLMLAGGLAGMLSWVVSMPQDVVKSCVQSQKLDGPQLAMTQIVRARLQQEGPGFFFKGFSATMLRAFPVSAVTFLVYEKVMQFMS